MICTFGDTTDVTWWRELQLPTRAILGRDGRVIAEPPPGLDSEAAREAYGRLAGLTVHSAKEAMVALLRESGDLVGEPRPITHMVKFYEKGDKPLEVVTSRQWYIRNGGRDQDLREALVARGPRDHLAPGLHAVPLRELGRGAQRRLAGQPAALLRRPVPGLVPPRQRRQPGLRRTADPGRVAAPGRPVVGVPGRLHGRTARRARGFHRRPRHHGHLGDVLAQPADHRRLGARRGPVRARLPHGPAPAGARHHPHLALRVGGPGAHRVRHRPVEARRHLRVDPRPRPQEDGQVLGQRPDTGRHARGARVGRRALLGRLRSARHGHRLRREPDEDRPSARHQDPERVEVRARARLDGRRRRRHRAARPRAPHRARRPSSTGPPRPSTPTSTPAPSRSPRRSSGPSATTTSSWSRSGRTAPADRRQLRRRRPPSPSRSRSSSGCSRPSSPSSPKRSGRGGRRARSTGPRGRPPTSCRRPPATRPSWVRPAWP